KLRASMPSACRATWASIRRTASAGDDGWQVSVTRAIAIAYAVSCHRSELESDRCRRTARGRGICDHSRAAAQVETDRAHRSQHLPAGGNASPYEAVVPQRILRI